jgi:hypothetical protein
MVGLAVLVVVAYLFLPEVLVALKDFVLLAIQKAMELIQTLPPPY